MVVMLALPAFADQTQYVDMTFQNGATFVGTINFADDFQSVTGVNGILSGYQYGVTDYVGSGSDTMSWIWYPGNNFAPVGTTFGTFLMDGTGYTDYTHWISFTYDYSAAPQLTFASVGYGNVVDYQNPAVSTSLLSGQISAVPEPSSLLLLGSGLAAAAGVLRRKLAR